MNEVEKLKQEIKELLSILETQKEIMTQTQSLLKTLTEHVQKNRISIDCLISDYSNVASIVQSIHPQSVLDRITICSGRALDPNSPSKLN